MKNNIKRIAALSLLLSPLISQAADLEYYMGLYVQGVKNDVSFNAADEAFQIALDAASQENYYAAKQGFENSYHGLGAGLLFGLQKKISPTVNIGLETGFNYISNQYQQTGFGTTYHEDRDIQYNTFVDAKIKSSYLIPLMGVLSFNNFFIKAGGALIVQNGNYNVITHYTTDETLEGDTARYTNKPITNTKIKPIIGAGYSAEIKQNLHIFAEYNYIPGATNFLNFADQGKTIEMQTFKIGLKKVMAA